MYLNHDVMDCTFFSTRLQNRKSYMYGLFEGSQSQWGVEELEGPMCLQVVEVGRGHHHGEIKHTPQLHTVCTTSAWMIVKSC